MRPSPLFSEFWSIDEDVPLDPLWGWAQPSTFPRFAESPEMSGSVVWSGLLDVIEVCALRHLASFCMSDWQSVTWGIPGDTPPRHRVHVLVKALMISERRLWPVMQCTGQTGGRLRSGGVLFGKESEQASGAMVSVRVAGMVLNAWEQWIPYLSPMREAALCYAAVWKIILQQETGTERRPFPVPIGSTNGSKGSVVHVLKEQVLDEALAWDSTVSQLMRV
jgi:hypothetical protein